MLLLLLLLQLLLLLLLQLLLHPWSLRFSLLLSGVLRTGGSFEVSASSCLLLRV